MNEAEQKAILKTAERDMSDEDMANVYTMATGFIQSLAGDKHSSDANVLMQALALTMACRISEYPPELRALLIEAVKVNTHRMLDQNVLDDFGNALDYAILRGAPQGKGH